MMKPAALGQRTDLDPKMMDEFLFHAESFCILLKMWRDRTHTCSLICGTLQDDSRVFSVIEMFLDIDHSSSHPDSHGA